MLRVMTIDRLEEGKENKKGRNGKARSTGKAAKASVTCVVLGNTRLSARKPVAGLAGRTCVAMSPETAPRAGLAGQVSI
jgi:hypothetical protein